jgi:hypothetical protein
VAFPSTNDWNQTGASDEFLLTLSAVVNASSYRKSISCCRSGISTFLIVTGC